MTAQLRAATIVLFIMLGVLVVGYVYGLTNLWHQWMLRPVRVTYFLSDMTIVIPLGIIAGLGIFASRRWATQLFILVLGALLFDTAHQAYYLLWDNYFGVPLVLPFLLLLAVCAYVVWGYCAASKAVS